MAKKRRKKTKKRTRKSKLPFSFSPETSSGGIFSDDIITEFLLRLPVESLLRCKSVSKTWFSLISDPRFIKSHLTRSITTAGAKKTMMVKLVNKFSISQLSSSDHEFDHSEGVFPFEPDLVVGSACGIVCVCVRECNSTLWCRYMNSSHFCVCKTQIYLWNPATKRCKLLPWFHFDENTMNVCSGFGFDPISNSFKVVIVVEYMATVFSLVFSTNMSSWRKVHWPCGAINLCGRNHDVCVSGYMCFRAYNGMMLAFDLNKEVFVASIKHPAFSPTSRIIDYNDSVSVICPENNVIKLWTLDDESCLRSGGVRASWTLMLSIDVPMRVLFVRDYFSSGDLLLMSEGVWYMYNSDKKETRAVPVPVCKYAESLVSITKSKPVARLLH